MLQDSVAAVLLGTALLGLLLFANSTQGRSPDGVLTLFLMGLLSSLGFLLFGGQRLDAAVDRPAGRVEHSA